MSSYVLSLDQGTSSSRAILFDREGAPVAEAGREFPQIYPQAGWVEHDPEEIWSSQLEAARDVLARAAVESSQVAAIGITNQRETTVVWERASGRPLCNAIVWQCRRTAPMCDEMRRRGLEPLVRERTGLVIDAYFSATKLRWILDHVPGARQRAERGELAFGAAVAGRVFFAAGARTVYTGLPSFREVSAPAELDEIPRRQWGASSFVVVGFHPMGTARMGRDPEACALRPSGETYALPGLFVADASILPSCVGVNPQITIMAMATRIAGELARQLGGER